MKCALPNCYTNAGPHFLCTAHFHALPHDLESRLGRAEVAIRNGVNKVGADAMRAARSEALSFYAAMPSVISVSKKGASK